MKSTLAAFLLCGPALSGCRSDPASSRATSFSALPGNSFNFVVDAKWSPGAQPANGDLHDPIPDAEYVSMPAAVLYTVVFSEDGTVVRVTAATDAAGTPSCDGRREAVHATTWSYQISAGLFAGGSFRVTPGPRLRAALTIYGSGVPVVASWRGCLERR